VNSAAQVILQNIKHHNKKNNEVITMPIEIPFLVDYILTLLTAVAWTGFILFLLSQYIRFNFLSFLVPLEALVIAAWMFPGVNTALMGIIINRYPFTPAFFMLIGLLIAHPVFNYFFYNRGLGPGKKLIRTFPENKGQVFLTFDDGPSGGITGEIMEILKDNDVTAIFFIVGMAGYSFPNLLTQLKQSGMEIGVHSFSHRPLPFLSRGDIEYEIDMSIELIRETTGEMPRFFRPPWGFYDKEVIEIAKSRGLETILWSRCTKDWKEIPPGEIVRRAVTEIKPGEIILLHDGHKEGASRVNTVKALPEIIKTLKNSGLPIGNPRDIHSAR
jgi:peptidoglycan-N-acetylglucosamine deacetylase